MSKTKPKTEKKKKTSAKQRSGPSSVPRSMKGMSDILPKDALWWKTVSDAAYGTAELHDFHFIETPILEPADLFESGIGENTDIVEKQMYMFKTRGDDKVALRPEGTAPVMRSYFEHHLGYFALPLKVFYIGPMFRYEKPQAGRERQFHQWGIEIIGDNDPIYDAEVIVATMDFLRSLKLKNLTLKINTIGCRVCRPGYRERLKSYYQSNRSKLCRDCDRRLDTNILRLLDCKEEKCAPIKAQAPIVFDHLCQACNNHFKSVLEFIEDASLVYEPDPYLVRGLDYYNRTVFEIFSSVNPGIGALGGGGRYDYLGELMGGRSVPGVGSATGLERVIEAMKSEEVLPNPKTKPKVYFTAVGEQARKGSFRIMNELRSNGVAVLESLGKKSLKAQLKVADKVGAHIALIFGQREVFEESIIIRDMKSGAQETVMLNKLVEIAKKRLRGQ